MKKYLWMIAAIAIVAVGCKKEEQEPVDETPAQLVSFQILAADNEGLEADYAPEVISESMIIRVPGGGQGKTFVATLTAGENDVIKVNDEAVENGKASFDASYAVDIVVTNSKSNKSAQYEVKIGKILQITSKKEATFVSSGAMVYTNSSYKAAINPSTGELYLAYSYTPEGGVKNIGVVKYADGQFAQVGAEGIVPAPAEGSAVAVSSICSIAFDASGAPYILYYGGDARNNLSMRKFNGASWDAVGALSFSGKINTSWSTPRIYFDASGNPGFAYTTTTYGGATFQFDGKEWVSGTINGFPAYTKEGSRGKNEGIFYGGVTEKVGDKTYGMFQANWYGLYIYELSGSSWSNAIVSDFIAAGETTMLPGNATLMSTSDGKLLAFTAHWTAGQMQIYELDGNTLKAYGSPFTVSISTSGTPDAAAVAINPATGEIFAVKVDADDYIMYSVMNADKQWEDFAYIGTTTQKASEEDPTVTVTEHDAAATYAGMFFGFDKSGKAVVIYPDDARGTNGFHVYSIGLEDDVLPE